MARVEAVREKKEGSLLLSYTKRSLRLFAGLILYGFVIYLVIQANIGLSPWEALSFGISLHTGLLLGDIVVLTGLVILGVDALLKEQLGFGTLFNTILIGKAADFFVWLDPVPLAQSYAYGIPLLLLSQVLGALSCYLYIGAGLGAGPRDSLMVALGKRLSRVPIGAVRTAMEGTVLLIGWLLGAKIGLGTIITVFGFGAIMQWTFQLLRFDVKGVKHENLADTVRNWRRGEYPAPIPPEPEESGVLPEAISGAPDDKLE